MSEFTDLPIVQLSINGKKCSVYTGFCYEIGNKGSRKMVSINAGDKSDGLSLPWFLLPIRLFSPRWHYLKATLVHDKLCQDLFYLDENGAKIKISQRDIDREFRTSLIALGMNKYFAQAYYYAVRFYQILSGRG